MDRIRTRGDLRHRMRTVALAAVTGVVSALLVSITSVSAVSASDPCGANGNKISCENSKPGTPRSQWDVGGAGNSDIQGFSTDISTNVGGRVDFKVDTNARAYSVKIYRTGYYQGLGARYIDSVTPSATLPQAQPQCVTDATTELYDCGNWGVSASWNVPSTAVSGVYEALLTRTDNGDQSAVTFVVRDDSSRSGVVFQTSDPTWQAYNTYGGSDFYQGAANGRAYKISYNRPVLTRGVAGGRDFYYANEYPAVEFLERNGYDVSYIAGVDSDRLGGLLTNHKTFMSVGHDEYWSKAQRANVEAARDAGVNLMFLSGNEVFWKTRYEKSADTSNTDYRTLVSYKETWSNAKIDPSDEWTGTWRDPRFAETSKGAGVPENGLTGTMFMANSDDLTMTVPAAQGKNRLWRNTSVATLGAGQTATLAPHTVGYESDEDVDNGSRPAGLIDVSRTVGYTNQLLTDFGSRYTGADTTHSMTLYKASSGALVFGAGTIQWTWGLDANHDSPYAAQPADVRMQQFQVNLLADMSAQPTSLQGGLVPASTSTDTVGPAVTITAPSSGAAKANGSSATVAGTAADTGGGIVAGIEVSTDGGGTWHPATGTSSWTYSYVQHGVGSTPIKVRASDDSANIGPVVTRSVSVSCPCSVYGATVPAAPDSGDASAVELGLRFTPTSNGAVTGVRFYKSAANTGTHTGTLWSSSGQSLASVTFSGESASGWQSANFSTPVPVTAGTTYVVSYAAPKGHYSQETMSLWSRGIDATPLSVAGGFGTTPASVYGNTGRFPNKSYDRDQYYVDALFTTSDTSPLSAGSQWPLPSSSSVPASTTVSATYSKALAAGTQGLVLKDANGVAVPGSTTYNAATRTITFTPNAALNGFVKYTATLSGSDTQGNAVSTGKTWSFTTARPSNAPGVCPCSIFDDNTGPTQLEDPDSSAVTLGVTFSSDVSGTVTGVRFYKGVNNTGTHTGTLWAADGTQLATGTFSNESTTGWQDLTFSSPVAITKNTTYVASYRTAVGRYSVTPNAFSGSDLSKPPLRVTSAAGVYSYSDGFPVSSSSSSYLVDVVFEKSTPTITVTSQDPANGAVSVPRGATLNTTFSRAISSGYTETVTQGPGNTPVPGSTSLSQDGTVLIFTPSSSLPANVDIKVVLSGVTSTDGAALPTQTTTFRTAGATASADQTLFTDQIPATPAENDGAAVELGTAFTPAVDGQVSAIRFYKGVGNLGTHVGSLWTAGGTKLASVTFTGETAGGWQRANLSNPVPVTAGTTYVVSYLAPKGHYSVTGSFFSSPLTSGDLTAPSGTNGRYLYGAAGGFPTYSYRSSSYFVDVVFQKAGQGTPTLSVTSRTPAPGAAGVSTGVSPTVTFSSPITTGYTLTATSGTNTIAGSTSLSSDKVTVTFTPSNALPNDADVTIKVSNVTGANGASLASDSATFRTVAAGAAASVSMFDSVTPATAADPDRSAIEIGTAFTPSVAGQVTGIKFYKGAGNTGIHTGTLWSSSGTNLARVTFTNETASGWQTATLATPIALTAGTTYVVSYFAPSGGYSVTENFFSSPWTVGPLTAPSANNGRYIYSGTSKFPTSSYRASNYFVDVAFNAQP